MRERDEIINVILDKNAIKTRVYETLRDEHLQDIRDELQKTAPNVATIVMHAQRAQMYACLAEHETYDRHECIEMFDAGGENYDHE